MQQKEGKYSSTQWHLVRLGKLDRVTCQWSLESRRQKFQKARNLPDHGCQWKLTKILRREEICREPYCEKILLIVSKVMCLTICRIVTNRKIIRELRLLGKYRPVILEQSTEWQKISSGGLFWNKCTVFIFLAILTLIHSEFKAQTRRPDLEWSARAPVWPVCGGRR